MKVNVQTLLLCGGVILVMAGCVSSVPRNASEIPPLVQNDAEASPLVTQVLAPASSKTGGNPGSTLMKVTLLSQECFQKNLKRGVFEDRVRAILRESGVEFMTIEYTDGTKKKISRSSQEQI